MNYNYQILGINEDASDEEIKERYTQLKKKYNEDRWLDGEAGNEAARMLNKLDTAYLEIMNERRERAKNTSGSSAFDEVTEALKKDDLESAQKKLDDFNERNAEWHYLQSVVFYKKNWMNESKKQLEIAMQLDKNNAKYKEAYDKLVNRMNYQANPQPNYDAQNGDPNGQQNGQQNGNPYANPDAEQMGGNFCNSCFQCCYTYLCVNCLFNLCCGCR